MGIDTNIMSLCVLEAEISENMKFADFAGGHFGNDVIQIVHPILVMVASIFHGERGPMNKIKQVPYCPGGGGVHGGSIGSMDYSQFLQLVKKNFI